LRAGQATGTEWDAVNIGNHSMAFGLNTKASGELSMAMGASAQANAFSSIAIGNGVVVAAAADNSIIIGAGTAISPGGPIINTIPNSLMVGFNSSRTTLFVGPSIGPSTTGKIGIGTQAPAFQLSLEADGANTFGGILAEGLFVTGSGPTVPSSVRIRMFWYPKRAAFRAGQATGTQWNDVNIGDHSAAFGLNTIASGTASFAIGLNTIASGDPSFVIGNAAATSGNNSFVMGRFIDVQVNNAFAFGTGFNSANPLSNINFPNSFMIGFDSNRPTFFVQAPVTPGIGAVGRVGIGTTSPAELFHVAGAPNGGGGFIRTDALSGGGVSVATSPLINKGLVIVDQNGTLAEKLTFTGVSTDVLLGTGEFGATPAVSDGDWDVNLGNQTTVLTNTVHNVGIGTAIPQTKTHIFKTSSNPGSTTLRLEYDFTGPINAQNPSSWDITATSFQGNLEISRSGNPAVVAISPFGRVGINTTSPSVDFDVNGSVRIRQLPTTTTITGVVVADANGNLFRNAGGDGDWSNAGSGTMSASAINDRVLIGTTTPFNAKLFVSNNTEEVAGRFVTDGSVPFAVPVGVQGIILNPNSFGINIGVSGFVDGPGNVNAALTGIARNATVNRGISVTAQGGNQSIGIFARAFGGTNNRAGVFDGTIDCIAGGTCPSDIILKQNIQPLIDATGLISQFQPQTFYFDTANFPMNLPSKLQYGLTAQQVEFVLPELISTSIYPARYDISGNQISAEVQYKSIDYEPLITILIQGFKELKQENDSIKVVLTQCCSQQQQKQFFKSGGDGSSGDTKYEEMKKELTENKAKLNELKSILREYGLNLETGEIRLESNRKSIILNQNDPNPFKEYTNIKYFIPDYVNTAKLVIFDYTGKLIKDLNIENGFGNIRVYASDISSGIYSYSIIADGQVIDSKKMVLTK